jgi:hypothetical protein
MQVPAARAVLATIPSARAAASSAPRLPHPNGLGPVLLLDPHDHAVFDVDVEQRVV